MRTNKAGLDLVKKWEGLRLDAYPDPATGGEPWTIGYGHTSAAGLPKVYKGLSITEKEAEEILVRDLAIYESEVLKKLTRTPNENQFAAMVSLCYNIGPGNFSKSSVLRLFNDGNMQAAADAFRLWNKAAGKVMQGLVNRREDERLLFLKPVSPAIVITPAVEPPKKGNTMGTIAKAIAAFLTSLVALVAALGFATDWATPGLIEGIAALLGAVVTGAMTWLIPNKPAA